MIFLLFFALRSHPLEVLALSSFLPFRAYLGFEYFGGAKRPSVDSHKICRNSTELISPDRQLTVQSSPTNLLEQSSLIPGVIHTPSSSARKGTLTIAQGACGCTLFSLARQRGRPALRKLNDFGFLQSTAFTLGGQSLSSFQWPSCPRRAHGSFCLSLSSWALRPSND